jgi:MSHA pilin protein MshD
MTVSPINRSAKKLQGGFTLVETVIVIVLVGAMMAGMTSLFITNVGNSYRPYLRQKALAVANAFMDEITHKRWNECTPVGGGVINTGTGLCPDGITAIPAIGPDGETRSTYDDIDDYNAITAQTPPRDSSGAVMPAYTGYSVDVSVTRPGGAWNSVPAADVRLITVTVTSTTGESISVSSYRVNH